MLLHIGVGGGQQTHQSGEKSASHRDWLSVTSTEAGTLGPDEWLLFRKLPDYTARKKPQRKPEVIQLPLLDLGENRQEVSS